MMAADEYYIFTGREVVPPDVTRVRIDKSISVIPERAFHGRNNIEELNCHDGVKKVEEDAVSYCPSLRLVIMPGLEVVEEWSFTRCDALTDVECGKLEIIGEYAFFDCESLRSFNFPSIKFIKGRAFFDCAALANVKFGNKLEEIGEGAFLNCHSLENITLPLKDGMITDNNVFQGCENLKHVDLVEGELHETIAALLLEEWRNDMNEEIASINQILPNTSAGNSRDDAGGKAEAIRTWIRSVLRNIIEYKAQHQSYLNEAATTLQLAERAFLACRSLERITLPLKDGMISENVFQGCKNLKHVDLVEGAILHETTINALQMKEWRDDMNEEIASIKLILPTTPAGNVYGEVGGKAEAIRMWIGSVLHKIIHYKAEQHLYLKEATITLELALWKKRLGEINVPEGDEEGRAECRVKCGADIVMKNVLPFLELPPYTFGGED
ncbi:leucine-rich repeat domain-containing protein [Skeletonema marinoi]|uniref:Leucine-rich repeat domain-containing protein n=1 Tax=Skeletonema marinoi TaxID=267567 RepID=A0AAD8XTI2_9STRA|nr:leucine-rich repeat domain-containing protein [Skeletonema marinoi]